MCRFKFTVMVLPQLGSSLWSGVLVLCRLAQWIRAWYRHKKTRLRDFKFTVGWQCRLLGGVSDVWFLVSQGTANAPVFSVGGTQPNGGQLQMVGGGGKPVNTKNAGKPGLVASDDPLPYALNGGFQRQLICHRTEFLQHPFAPLFAQSANRTAFPIVGNPSRFQSRLPARPCCQPKLRGKIGLRNFSFHGMSLVLTAPTHDRAL